MDTTGGQQVPPIPQRVVGQYHLLAQLAQTPTGPVYLARLQHKEALFALKLLPPLGPDEMQRMRQDAGLLSRVEHPGVVRPVDLGTDRGRGYVVTEHVPGTTLREQLDRRGPLPPRQAARVAADVADALQAIHDAGAVHRHLDPSVIVVDGRDGRPKVSELGVARDPRRPPLPGQAPYLPFCMAPEQLRGERAEAKSDVYALGAVLYELLSGSPPFEGQSWSELSQEIQAGDPEPPSELVAGIPRGIERACLKALSLAPAHRPSAAELAKELRRASGGEHERGGSPLVAAALAAALVALVGAAAWGVWERRGRGEAEGALAGARVELEGLRRELASAKEGRASSQAELQQVRDQAARREQELDRGQAQARAEAAQVKAAGEQQRRALEQRLELTALAAAGAAAGHMSPAIDALIAAIEPAPGLVTLRARLLRERGRFDDLRQLLRAERARGPLPPELMYLELTGGAEGEQAEALLAELVALPEDSPYGAIGRLFAQQQPLEQGAAVALLQRAQQGSPDDPHLAALLADVLRQAAMASSSGQLIQQALQQAEAAVRLNPTSADVLLDRARLQVHAFQLTQGQQREFAGRALADLEAARAFSDAPVLWTEAARIRLLLGLPEVATATLNEARRRAQARNDHNELARTFVLMGLVRLAGGDEAGAVSNWSDALRAYPNLQGTYEFVQYLPRLSADGQRRVLQAAPPNMRQQLEGMLRQGQQGGGR